MELAAIRGAFAHRSAACPHNRSVGAPFAMQYHSGMRGADLKAYVLTTGATAVLVLAALLSPQLLWVVPAVAVAYCLTKPWFRLIFFVLGALLVFQTGDGLSATKLAYLGGVALSVVGAGVNIKRHGGDPWIQRFKPALLGAGMLALWLLVPTMLQALVVNGVEPQMWARDALTYLLISAGVVIGVDACRTFSVRWARFITIGIGLIAAAGFAAAWVQKRGFGDTVDASPQGLLASLVALTIPLALCLVLGLAQRWVRLPWILLGSVFLIAVLVTGTRTGFVLVLALVGIWGSASKLRAPIHKLIAGAIVGAAAVAVALPIAGAWVSSESFVQQRIDLMVRTLQLGFSQDYSGLIRERAYEYSMDIFNDNPLMGQGLGIYFPNPNPNSAPSNFAVDTYAIYFAKFGILGTAVLVASLALIIAPLVLKRNGPSLFEVTAMRGALITWVAILPFGPTTEDKGFAISIALGVLLVGSAHRQSMGRPTPENAPAELAKTKLLRVPKPENQRLASARRA